jgi:hypothetical protein
MKDRVTIDRRSLGCHISELDRQIGEVSDVLPWVELIPRRVVVRASLRSHGQAKCALIAARAPHPEFEDQSRTSITASQECTIALALLRS